MKWIVLIAMTGALAGCTGPNKGNTHNTNHVDPDSIAEEPQPDIQYDTFIAAGDLAVAQGQNGRAAEQYEKAVKSNPRAAVAVKKLALAYVRSGQTAKSIDAWKRYVSVTDGSADAYGSLGYAYELAGKPADAEKTYQEGIQKHPDGALVRINYGLMLVRREKIDDAVKQLSAVLQPHEVNYDIGSVYEQMGRKDLATFYYRRALECNPQFSPAKQKLLVATN
jgi:Tfp pilus assembly protein PilF